MKADVLKIEVTDDVIEALAREAKSFVVRRPEGRELKKLYATLRHSTVDQKTGELSFDPRYPWSKALSDTLNNQRDYLRVDGDRTEPIQGRFDTDHLEYLASFLSEEVPVFLPRVWSSQIIDTYPQEYSLVEARNFVRSHSEYSIQYGWIVHRKAMWLFAEFHAAVKSPEGRLQLLQRTPGAPIDRGVVFIPDDKNKPDFENNSSPAMVGLNLFGNRKFAIGKRERVLLKSRILYQSTDPLMVSGNSKLVSSGKCPHQPSETMDLIGDIRLSEIIARLKNGKI